MAGVVFFLGKLGGQKAGTGRMICFPLQKTGGNKKETSKWIENILGVHHLWLIFSLTCKWIPYAPWDWNIYHIYHRFKPNVVEYSSCMEHLGMKRNQHGQLSLTDWKLTTESLHIEGNIVAPWFKKSPFEQWPIDPAYLLYTRGWNTNRLCREYTKPRILEHQPIRDFHGPTGTSKVCAASGVPAACSDRGDAFCCYSLSAQPQTNEEIGARKWWYCWWFRNPKQPPGMVLKPCK